MVTLWELGHRLLVVCEGCIEALMSWKGKKTSRNLNGPPMVIWGCGKAQIFHQDIDTEALQYHQIVLD
jgi:hypothetical protein